MNLSHSLLGEIGILTPRLNEIIADCKEMGALGAKSTGAGGGGCVLALLDPERQAEQLKVLQEKNGKGRVLPCGLQGTYL